MLRNAPENLLGSFGIWGMFWVRQTGQNVLGKFWAVSDVPWLLTENQI
jgi:hypothetical protein